MKQAREYGAVDVADTPLPPDPADHEVLVKIHSAALCGSDLHAYEYIQSYRSFMHVPVVLGHEGSGVVVAVGDNVTAFCCGDRVMGESNIYCGTCCNCRKGMTNICSANLMRGLTTTGVLQEYVLFSEKNLHRIPDTVSFDEGAAAQAATVSVHGVLNRIHINPGDSVLVSGMGIIGLVAAQLARQKGARVTLSGTSADEETRIPLALSMGFHTVNCQQQKLGDVFERYHGQKADFVLECSGAASALLSAVDLMRKGGSILLLGLPDKDISFPFATVIRGEINLISSYTSSWDDYEKTLKFIAEGRIDIKPMLTAYPVEQVNKAFEDALQKKVLKPVVRFV